MTDKLLDHVHVPNWVIILFVTTIVGLFTTGWVKIDNMQKDLVIEKTSRQYIEQMLSQIDKKLERIESRLDKK